MTTKHRVGLVLLTTCALAGLGACSSDEIQQPLTPVEGELTVDASTTWGYASLDEGEVVAVADPAGDPGWDMGFNTTRVMLNGGAAGPGGVTGTCLCQNAGAKRVSTMLATAEYPSTWRTLAATHSQPLVPPGGATSSGGWY